MSFSVLDSLPQSSVATEVRTSRSTDHLLEFSLHIDEGGWLRKSKNLIPVSWVPRLNLKVVKWVQLFKFKKNGVAI